MFRTFLKLSSKDSKETLNTNKYGLKKQRKKLQKKNIHNKINLKDKKIYSAIEIYKKKKLQDQTENNLYILERFSEKGPFSKSVEKLLKCKSQLSKNNQKDNSEESTVFTEEDFKKFEIEYKLK